MTLFHVIILAIVQGFAELLPISSSAHVIVAEELMGMNPAAPQMTLLLVMLHTGTMFAVIVYFWNRWRRAYFQSVAQFRKFAIAVIFATFLTGLIGGGLIEGIEHVLFRNQAHAWVEQLFGHLNLIAPALAAGGILILAAGLLEKRQRGANPGAKPGASSEMTMKQTGIIGAVQGLCLPFRGFSRSGATISAGMLSGVAKARAEDFSFALAVAITPAAIARELYRLIQMQHIHHGTRLAFEVLPSVLGAFFAFLAGLVALKWLSRWLESGRWYIFGIYCLFAACVVGYLYHAGF
ncbi:MAG TPA: undecaprenyl-diphosphate phosphatase [Candidatus Dormibacteraeota bacterium]|nr:undecaprenyl-diphosphate phosphatase [Candidatus Dormibacteraeota bacterium]